VVDDREMWERICKGDARAFEDFYRDSGPRLQSFLRQLVGNAQAAEDIVQETYLQIWRKPNGFRPERGSLRAYLFGIGRKRAAEWWRQRQPNSDGQVPEDFRKNAETTSLMGDAFSRLGAEQRALLWLREVEGQSYAELAEILEIPAGTVKSRLFTAREELRRIWHSERPRKMEVL
jgi:RNA polymerase sigma-70 factor (ECF subfamily)